MSGARSWDLTVPEDDAELGAELRRHGVVPGQRLRVVALSADEGLDGVGPEQGRFRFAGLIENAPSDLAANADGYLAGGFGRP
ncbi:hypothetical protein SAMN06264364_1155 [Quadrisphaera granulorum]|uniref:Uncharacterized protein n=1 Tax=Quadrisphaera granulorum TaxID=317664 RepID=A0A316A6Y8_9ACTN|nr:hypothetical protein [Quadrisphaera granulorum]PWJ52988.1 hypothetical protein BXY45_1155 [Quadrisphaera granulorum]SZE97153.1 hypothetical protein SAMN06264364_1155 [Quadrisphaera granulorum]